MLWIGIFFWFSCTNKNRSAADCSQLSQGEERDDCWSTHILELVKKNEKQAIKVVEEQVESQQIKDFIWLQITREYNPATRKYCAKIQDKALAKRCQTLVSRPHLHRDILREKK